MKSKARKSCGHIYLRDPQFSDDYEGLTKKGTCLDCGAIVVAKYTLLKRIIYDQKGSIVDQY